MARGRTTRHVKASEEESDDELDYDTKPVSPTTLKEVNMALIMQADLGEGTADMIKRSDYGARQQTSSIPIVRRSDIKGTEEAAAAAADKEKLAKWIAFARTDEAMGQAYAAGPAINPQGHRQRMTKMIKEEEKRLGHKIDLEDTYDDQDHGRPGKNIQLPRASLRETNTGLHSRPGHPANAPSKPSRGQSTQQPRAPMGKSSFTAATQLNPITTSTQPSATQAVRANASTTSSQLRVRKVATAPTAETLPSSSRMSLTPLHELVDPSTFMSAVNKLIPVSSKATPQSQCREPALTEGIGAVAAGGAVVSKETPAQFNDHPNEGSIRCVPVHEFAFHYKSLAPGEVATHTDGNPSPATLSELSEATSHEPQEEMTVKDTELVGLGILSTSNIERSTIVDPASTTTQAVVVSQTRGILDSPALDEVSNNVLVTEKGNVAIINGHRYVLESKLLALQTPESPPTTVQASAELGAESSAPPASLSVTTSRPSLLNPFNSREPLSSNNANVSTTATITAGTSDAASITAATQSKGSQPHSVHPIESKWAIKPNLAPTKVKASRPPISNSLPSRWAVSSAEPTTAPPAKSSTNPIIGDRRVFGHLSTFAAQGQAYKKSRPVRKYDQPGPGTQALLAAQMGLREQEKTSQENVTDESEEL